MSSNVPVNEVSRYRSLVENIVRGPIEIWQQRFSGQTFGGRYKNDSIHTLLVHFQDFSLDYFEWISERTPQNDSRQTRRILFKTLSNLSEEWAIISRACSQRENLILRHELNDTDKYAQELYKRFTQCQVSFTEETTAMPVTYYGKLYAITRYAFTNVPILSIPMHTLGSPNYWQSGLAHELGHHFYWNSTQSTVNLQKMHERLRKRIENAIEKFITNNPDCAPQVNAARSSDNGVKNRDKATGQDNQNSLVQVWQNWHEDLFADICGTLLIGPQYVETSLRMVDEYGNTIEELVADDLHHPLLYLRPYIGIIVLDWIIGHPDNALFPDLNPQVITGLYKTLQTRRNALYLRWQTLVNLVESATEHNHLVYTTIPLKCIQDSLPVVVEAILYQENESLWMANESECNVVDLVQYSTWLAAIQPETTSEDSIVDIAAKYEQTKTTSSEILSKYRSPFFEDLLATYSKEHQDGKELFNALLELDLGTEEGMIGWAKVRYYVKRGNARIISFS